MSDSSKPKRDHSKQTPRIHEMTDFELGWLAGWLEGEGSFCIYLPYNNNPNPNFVVCAKSTDRDVIETAQRITGVGRIKFDDNYSRKNSQWKNQYGWTVARRVHVRPLITTLMPYLHKRRRARALEVLAAMDEYERQMDQRHRRGIAPDSGLSGPSLF